MDAFTVRFWHSRLYSFVLLFLKIHGLGRYLSNSFVLRISFQNLGPFFKRVKFNGDVSAMLMIAFIRS